MVLGFTHSLFQRLGLPSNKPQIFHFTFSSIQASWVYMLCTRQVRLNRETCHFYSRNVRFEFRSEHRLPSPNKFVVFLRTSRQILGRYLNLEDGISFLVFLASLYTNDHNLPRCAFRVTTKHIYEYNTNKLFDKAWRIE